MTKANVLTIGGTDPLHGAGITADLTTIEALSGKGFMACTGVIAQNHQGVRAIEKTGLSLLKDQLDCIFESVTLKAIKIGVFFDSDRFELILERILHYGLGKIPIVLDPVMRATGSGDLIEPSGLKALMTLGLEHLTLITPNAHEFEILKAIDNNLLSAKTNWLIKGGHTITKGRVTDHFYQEGHLESFEAPALHVVYSHGTGCALSTGITTFLAQGYDLRQAVILGKCYVRLALTQGYAIGNFCGTINRHISKEEVLLDVGTHSDKSYDGL